MTINVGDRVQVSLNCEVLRPLKQGEKITGEVARKNGTLCALENLSVTCKHKIPLEHRTGILSAEWEMLLVKAGVWLEERDLIKVIL